MLAEFSVIPIGTGESMGEAIAGVMKIVAESGLPYRANAMGTIVEGEWDEIMGLVRKCQDAVLKKAPRALTNIALDVRPGKPNDRLTEKLISIEKRLGRKLKT
ncbi:MAG: MTH1187 family thiamine-binding protein [Deltaproteobacteria bacterium]|nr:MTH1187 family thiamine-binding protein [Deltaproteobacteria bacterium]